MPTHLYVSARFVYCLVITHLSISLICTSPPTIKLFHVTPTISTTVKRFYDHSLEDKRKVCRCPSLAWKLFLNPLSSKQKVVEVEATEEDDENELSASDNMPPKKSELHYILLNYLLNKWSTHFTVLIACLLFLCRYIQCCSKYEVCCKVGCCRHDR